MGIFLKDASLEQALAELLGFLGLALLGWLLVQLIYWDNLLKSKRQTWLKDLRRSAKQLRNIRRTLEKAQDLPDFPMPASLRSKWRVVRWMTTALSAAKWARP